MLRLEIDYFFFQNKLVDEKNYTLFQRQPASTTRSVLLWSTGSNNNTKKHKWPPPHTVQGAHSGTITSDSPTYCHFQARTGYLDQLHQRLEVLFWSATIGFFFRSGSVGELGFESSCVAPHIPHTHPREGVARRRLRRVSEGCACVIIGGFHQTVKSKPMRP